jgi:hypothetical protein
MVPEVNENGKFAYVAEGSWNLLGGCDFTLVAGMHHMNTSDKVEG